MNHELRFVVLKELNTNLGKFRYTGNLFKLTYYFLFRVINFISKITRTYFILNCKSFDGECAFFSVPKVSLNT